MLKTSGSAGNSIFLPSNPELVPASSSAHSQTHKKNITDLHRLLLIEDSTRDEVPSHLVTLFKALEPRRPSRADILAILVYAHALESGFYPSGAVQIGPRIETCWSYSFNTQFVKTFSSVLPDIYHGYDMGSYDFRLELFSHSRQFCLLLARETDDRLCINFITEQRAHSVVVLPISRYIKRQSLQSPAKCLQNVKELSMRLRGELFLPMRNAVLAVETSLYPGLLGLPGELQQTIMAYLDSKALQQLAITCVSMCNQVFAFKNVRSRKFGSARPEIQWVAFDIFRFGIYFFAICNWLSL